MVKSLPDGALDAISRTLGDAMVGSDIGRVLTACGLADTSGESTKWKRLYGTFLHLRKRYKCANNVFAFFSRIDPGPARSTCSSTLSAMLAVRAIGESQ